MRVVGEGVPGRGSISCRKARMGWGDVCGIESWFEAGLSSRKAHQRIWAHSWENQEAHEGLPTGK